MEGYTLAFLTTTPVSTTKGTTSVSTTTSALDTDPTLESSKTGFIPLNEVHKDIILLSLAGVFFFTFLVLICVLTRNKRKRNDMAMEFQNLTATSSTTVFDKRQ